MTDVARPRARRMSREGREQVILAHAVALFADGGFAVNTRELARRAGVTQSLMYRYFPSKQALLDKVFEQVYLSKWKDEWTQLLRNRAMPIGERLQTYYRDYAQTILVSDWVRILIFSGLKEPAITQKLFELLRSRIFEVVADEINASHDLQPAQSPEEREMEIEIVWAVHASLFYIGMRRWIYHTPVPVDLGPLLQVLVGGMLQNFVQFKALTGAGAGAADADSSPQM